MNEVDERSSAETIMRTADKLRALCNAGLRYAEDPYQKERYEQILEMCADLTGLVDGRPLPEIKRQFFADTHYTTPYAVVDTAVFDDAGRLLLIRRADNRRWALPGGACEVGEPPGEGALREVWEETGCRAALSDLLGIFDISLHSSKSLHHLYCLLFAGRIIEGSPIVTGETIDVGWFAAHETPWDALHASHPARTSASRSTGSGTHRSAPSTTCQTGSRSRPGNTKVEWEARSKAGKGSLFSIVKSSQ